MAKSKRVLANETGIQAFIREYGIFALIIIGGFIVVIVELVLGHDQNTIMGTLSGIGTILFITYLLIG